MKSDTAAAQSAIARIAKRQRGVVSRQHAFDAGMSPKQITRRSLVLAGWTLLRFTWADVVESPEAVIEAVNGALAA